MIVMKFGGTSLKDAEAIVRSCAIIAEQVKKEGPVAVVVSALAGVTDDLERMGKLAADGRIGEARGLLEVLQHRHCELLGEASDCLRHVGTSLELIAEKGLLDDQQRAMLVSRGEILSSLIVAEQLKGSVPALKWLNATHVMVAKGSFLSAVPDVQEIKVRANRLVATALKDGSTVVIGGFIASNEAGKTVLLGRGASDFTATLLGEAIDAECVQIWTDVDGVLTADPNRVPEALSVKTLSFPEASKMTYRRGAKVLHERAVAPARRSGIPILIKNSLNPEREGTTIGRSLDNPEPTIKAIACTEGVTLFTVIDAEASREPGFGAKITEILARHGVSFDTMSTEDDAISFTVVGQQQTINHLGQKLGEISSSVEVRIHGSLSLLSLVGDRQNLQPYLLGRALSSLRGIEIHQIAFGPPNNDTALVVNEGSANRALRALHHELFGDQVERLLRQSASQTR